MGEGISYNVTLSGAGREAPTLEVGRELLGSFANNLTCDPGLLPTVRDYYSGLKLSTGVTVFSLGSVAVIIIFTLFIDTLCHLLKCTVSGTKTHSVFIVSIYPVVAVAAYFSILVPRAHLLSEAVIQVMFMTCLYQLFCLVVAYCDGESGVMLRVTPKALNPRVAPCCCWPCCCLPPITLTKERIFVLRILVLQLPVIQTICYLIQLVMWADDQNINQVNFFYIQPIVIVSILLGVWAIVMTVRMLAAVLENHNLVGKYMILQFVLILTKFQTFFAKIPVWAGAFPCQYPMTPSLYSNLIYNSVLLWEMVVLAVLCRILYRKPTPDPYNSPMRSLNLPEKISSLSEKVSKSEKYSDNNNKTITGS